MNQRESSEIVSAVLAVVLLMGCSAADTAGPSGLDLAQPDNVGVVRQRVVAIGGTLGHQMTYRQCATEGQNCVVNGPDVSFNIDGRYVAFGAAGHFTYKVLNGPFACNTATFGTNPISGPKACYFSSYELRGAHEGDTRVYGSGNIAYGANGSFNFITLPTELANGGFYDCTNRQFATADLPDPAPGVRKACYVVAEEAAWMTEGESMDTFFTPVAYGANGNFVYTLLSGAHTCGNDTFGTDPSPGVVKTCYAIGYAPLAFEGQQWNFGPEFHSIATVLYGSGLNGIWLRQDVSKAQGPCTNTFFQGDPDVGQTKLCYGAD